MVKRKRAEDSDDSLERPRKIAERETCQKVTKFKEFNVNDKTVRPGTTGIYSGQMSWLFHCPHLSTESMAFPSLVAAEFAAFEDLRIHFRSENQDEPDLVPRLVAASNKHTLPGRQVIPALHAFYAPLIPQPYRRLTFPAPQPMMPNHWVLRAPVWF